MRGWVPVVLALLLSGARSVPVEPAEEARVLDLLHGMRSAWQQVESGRPWEIHEHYDLRLIGGLEPGRFAP